MQGKNLTRRSVLTMASGAAVAGIMLPARAQQVPWSKGTEPAKTKAPANATDCHHHIYSSRFPVDPKAVLRPGDALVADYHLLQKRIGTTRNIVVQPSTYGINNTGLIEALTEFGSAARGVAVVQPAVSDDELKSLHTAGVRGIRFNILTPGGATSVEMVEPLAKRIANMGWHLQFHVGPDFILANKDLLNNVPCPVVFDHMAHIPASSGTGHPAFAVVVDLLQKGKGWVKLSGPYMESKVGSPTYSDISGIAQAYVQAASQQLVWGSDWPHPTEKPDNKPDDAVLFDLLAEWVSDEATRNRILVDNPARLYGFS
jgi:predicted TIM-barrel fold metal-dependent hydrolase